MAPRNGELVAAALAAKGYFSVRDLAERHGVDGSTIRTWVSKAAGKIRSERVNGAEFVLEADIADLLKGLSARRTETAQRFGANANNNTLRSLSTVPDLANLAVEIRDLLNRQTSLLERICHIWESKPSDVQDSP